MTCPACDNPKAYIGFVTVECPNEECRNFCESMAPKENPAYEAIYRAIDACYSDMFKGINAWLPVGVHPVKVDP